MNPLCFQDRVNAWASINPTILLKKLLDLGGEAGIFSAVLARLTVQPGVIATLGNLKRLAEDTDGILLAVLRNERKGQSWLREKMPRAFFSMSRSCRSNSFSRFK